MGWPRFALRVKNRLIASVGQAGTMMNLPKSRSLPRQGQNIIESVRRRGTRLLQQIGPIRRNLRGSVDRQCPQAALIPIRVPRGSDGIGGAKKLFCFGKKRRQVDQHLVSSGISDERMVHDEQVIAIDVLFNRGFAKLTQRATIPANGQAGIALLIFRRSIHQRSIPAGMIPGQSGENDFHIRLAIMQS